MSWAAERRTFILIGIGLVAAAALAILAISIFHEVPSCMDNRQNQDEEGVDCGGSCTTLCAASAVPPKVVFVRTLLQSSGRVDVVAHIENPNPSAALAKGRYTVELYSPERVLIASVPGVIDLPPSGRVPIFVPGAYAGPVSVAQAFVVFDETSFVWQKGQRDENGPLVSDVVISDVESPRVSAQVHNQTTATMRALPVVATVFGEGDRVIAASRTVIAELPGLGSADIVFTWNEPWSEPPTRVDVRPIVPLP